jgi:hypothetical protein
MDARRYAPATERNRDAILAVLRGVLPASGTVLEIASGTGEHAVWFAQHLPALTFQPSDPDPELRASIAAWQERAKLPNLRPPIALDASAGAWDLPREVERDLAAILCINMIHIAPWEAALGLLAGAARLLRADQVLYLYGAYKRGGRHTSPSNAAFDASLRAQDPAWGVRDLETVIEAATTAGLRLDRVVPMPANNLSVVFRIGLR